MGYNLHPVVQGLLYHQGTHYPTFLLPCFAKTVFEWADCQRQTSYNPDNTAGWLVYPVWELVLTLCTYRKDHALSLIHISEPTRLGMISYAVFCLTKKKD